MTLRYVRKHARECYEQWLVEAINLIGFDCSLASDFADERRGVDAWIITDDYQVPVDFTTSCQDAIKARKEAGKFDTRGAVMPLFVTDDLICDLRCKSTAIRDAAANELWALIDGLLTASKAYVSCGCFRTSEEIDTEEQQYCQDHPHHAMVMAA